MGIQEAMELTAEESLVTGEATVEIHQDSKTQAVGEAALRNTTSMMKELLRLLVDGNQKHSQFLL